MSKAVKAHYVYQGGNIGQYYLCYAHCSNCGGYLLPKTEVCKTCGDKVKWTIPYHKNPGDSFEDQKARYREMESDKQTNADRIRNMSDEELAEWLTNMCDFEKNEEPYKSIYNLDTEQEEEIHDSYGDLLKWLQSEADQERRKNEID